MQDSDQAMVETSDCVLFRSTIAESNPKEMDT